MIGWIISAAFQFHFTAPAIDVTDRRCPSYKMRCQLQPKKTKVTLYYQPQKAFYPPFIANKTEHFNFKNGCVIRVENVLPVTAKEE